MNKKKVITELDNTECNYYGSKNPDEKPREGVGYMILDEYMLRSLDKVTYKARKDMERLLYNHNNHKMTIDKITNKLEKALDPIIQLLDGIDERLQGVIKENNLKMPAKKVVEKTVKKTKNPITKLFSSYDNTEKEDGEE